MKTIKEAGMMHSRYAFSWHKKQTPVAFHRGLFSLFILFG
ncbi:hypothetical protein SB48_HM08orf03794 [Heyndrickxia coagulans]|uniref:Uncharacterized protein n=1 Tax=Heyndrickxia coagulans TaxID=1398 RepID=A0AAN0T7R0_HEYCO|nr:hypothetical protein SB48_HM08orf03794 [Heyndrickxia coagulans]